MEENKMGVMPVRPLLLHMAWPMMLSMLIQALYNMVDSMFVSRLNREAFEALSLSYPVQMFMVAVCVGTGVGVNALLSRRLGQQDPEGANAVAMNGVFVYLLSWLFFLFFGLFLTRPLFGFYRQRRCGRLRARYLSLVTGCSIGMTCSLSPSVSSWPAATGRPHGHPGGGGGSQPDLRPLLIFGPGPFPALGVAGAAAATVMGQLTGMTVGFVLVARCRTVVLSPKGFRPQKEVIAELYRIGLPAIVMQSLATFMTLGLNKIMALFSSSAVFILGAYFKIQSFIFMPVHGLNNGMIPVVGYNYGARHRARITGLTRFALCIAVVIMAAGTLLLLCLPGFFLALFNAEPEVLGRRRTRPADDRPVLSLCRRLHRAVRRAPGRGGVHAQPDGLPHPADPPGPPRRSGPGAAGPGAHVAVLPPVRAALLRAGPAALPGQICRAEAIPSLVTVNRM